MLRYVLITVFSFLPVLVLAEMDSTLENVSHPPIGVIDPEIVDIGYSGREILQYDVSWSGGIKIGELRLEVTAIDGPEIVGRENPFEIKAFVSTKGGAVHLLYPISDVHVTRVYGPKKLPYFYEVWQEEGYSYKAHRVLTYDQEKRRIRYMKNDKLEGEYQVEGEVNNEFSSFFNSRLMDLSSAYPFVVPTFADKKRVEVAVYAKGVQKIEKTLLGDISAVKVMPVMKFKGLYDKKGDTVIWYSNDKCRVPVKINSKIAIGSLTAQLTEYENAACDIYPSAQKNNVPDTDIKGDT